MNNNLELLAPVGSMDNLKVAVSSGADAVYLGMQNFNARDKADNFTAENIKEVVDYCHLHNVKVYLTVNTIIKDNEINMLVDTIKSAVEANVDAYIVQDLGVATLLKNTFVNINLHASTQMGVHNLKGAKLIEEYGFSRVVLSREATLEDIKQIAQNTKLEIEYFVQGALCVAFSGNCYLSSILHGQSGNRGKCLQLCRLKYRSKLGQKNIQNGYLLSPTDLCLIDRLRQLKEAGVCSLKIEGRLRRAGYVAVATKEYRKAIDNLDVYKSQENLKKVFYRGQYNNGMYLDQKNPNIINKEYQNHRGQCIGTVINVKPFKDLSEIVIKSSHNLVQNDALKFVGKTETTLGVGNVKKLKDNLYGLISKATPSVGDKVYLMVDKAFEEDACIVADKINIGARFVAKIGKNIKLDMWHGDDCVSVIGELSQMAKTAPVSVESIRQQIGKLGDSLFVLDDFECDIDDIFVAKSTLNEMRRQAVSELSKKMLESYNLNNIKDIQYKEYYPKTNESKSFEGYIINDIKSLDGIQLKETDNIIISPTDYTDIKNIKRIKESLSCNVFLNTPIIACSKDIAVIENLLSAVDFDGVVANNLYALKLNAKRIIGGTGLNIANKYTQDFLKNMGIDTYIMTIEKDLYEKGINNYNGKPALMTFVHCPYKVNYGCECSSCKYEQGLTYAQESGKVFNIRRYVVSRCYFELLGDKVINCGKGIVDLR